VDVTVHPVRVPLTKARLVVLAALLLCFVLAFIGAGFSELWVQVPLILAGVATVGIACYWLGQSQRLSGAIMGAVVLATLGILAWLYGVYAAYWAGWRGLKEADFGSDDLQGHLYIWVSFVFNLWVPAVASLMAVVVALIGHSRHSRRHI
jgi:hypothetical protein